MSTNVEEFRRPNPNIFGFFRYFLTISPFNCSKSNPVNVVFKFFTLIAFLSMVFRMFWMFAMTDGETLSLAWSEKNMYAFIASTSFSCVIGIYKVTSNGSLAKFEQTIGRLQSLRNTKYHAIHDNYSPLYRKLFILLLPIFPAYICAALYLAKYKLVTFGNWQTNDWYYIANFIITILCAYVNFIYIPIYALMNSALRREFDVFNEELEESSKNKELSKIAILQNYGERQLKLFEFTRIMFGRYSAFMAFAPFGMLVAVICSGYITASFLGHIYLFYYFSILAISIVSVIMASFYMIPPAAVNESMLKTSEILLSEPTFQYSDDRMIHQTYRLMIDRSLHNKPVNNVMFIFALTKKNVERSLFVCANIVLAFSIASLMISKK